MENTQTKQSYLESITLLYKQLPPNTNWNGYWKNFFELQLPPFEEDPDKFIFTHCELISEALGLLGKEHETTKVFLLDLPLRFSKVIFDWPPPPDPINKLMTD